MTHFIIFELSHALLMNRVNLSVILELLFLDIWNIVKGYK